MPGRDSNYDNRTGRGAPCQRPNSYKESSKDYKRAGSYKDPRAMLGSMDMRYDPFASTRMVGGTI